jgi:hypothetical protein
VLKTSRRRHGGPRHLPSLVAVTLLLWLPAAHAHAGAPYWPLSKLMRVVDGDRIHIGERVVTVHKASMLCGGEGRAVRRRGVRAWRHYMCTYTTFRLGRPDRDLEFRVHVVGPGVKITDARWISPH